MRRFLLAAATATVAVEGIALSVPAHADYIGVGPVGVEVDTGYRSYGYDWDHGPRYRHGWRGAYAYGDDCRVIRDRTVTPSGRVIIQTRKICD